MCPYDRYYYNRMYKMQGKSIKVLAIIILLLVEFGMLLVIFTFLNCNYYD